MQRNRSVGGLAQKVLSLGRGLSLSAMLFLVLVAAPTAVCAVYYSVMASDRYVVEVKFTVRGVRGGQAGGLTALFRSIGITRAEDDTYAVIDFMLSRDGVRRLNERCSLRKIFNGPGVDLFSRYPRFWRGDSFETLYDYYLNRVEAWYQSKGGMVTLRVSAFRPQDAELLAQSLLRLSEELVNHINQRAHADAITYSEQEVARAQNLVIEAQKRLTAFRNSELMLDPVADSLKLVDLTVRLKGELADAQRQLNETLQGAPSNPVIPSLRSRIAALQQQIATERSKVVGDANSLAPKVAAYERLTLDRGFADRNLGLAFDALQAARQEARRQQLYIETVVSPRQPDEATEPRRARNVITVFVVGFCLFGMLWLIIAGSREHMHG
jgi:capsular polysaccharide transport system permease protein